MDFAREGLLEDLVGDARSARLELLERLSSEGATVEELKRAVEQERLALLSVERALSSDVRIDKAALARVCGLELAFVSAARQALGLPEAGEHEPVFREADVEAFRALGELRDAGLFSDDAMLEILAVVGHSLWRITETTLAVVDEVVTASGGNERELAERYADAARRLATVAGPVLESAAHAGLREGLREEVVTREEIRSGRIDDTWTVSVCFVDLVGSTGIGDRLPAEGAHALARRLTRIAAGVARPPVRLVKTMGDGAMLVSIEAEPLIEAALTIAEDAAQEDRLPPLRIGIAHGEAYARGGDWYGTTVNLASRITEIADPGTVLATRSAREAAPDSHVWGAPRRERLRGLSDEVDLLEVVGRA